MTAAVEPLAGLVKARGGVPAVAAAIGTQPARLDAILAGTQPATYRLRRCLAEHLGVDPAQLFPAWADHDAAVGRLLAARAEQGLAPTVNDPAALDKAAAIFNAAS